MDSVEHRQLMALRATVLATLHQVDAMLEPYKPEREEDKPKALYYGAEDDGK